MQILQGASCESFTGWTRISDGSGFISEIETHSGNFIDGVGAIALRYNTSSWPGSTNYAGVKQSITIPDNYIITFRLNAEAGPFNVPDFPNAVFEVMWNSTVIRSITFSAVPSWSWTNFTSNWRVWDQNDGVYKYRNGVYMIYSISLASYAGQTGELTFRVRSNYDGGGAHVYYYTMNIDYITESYTTAPTDHWYVRPGGAGVANGYDWNNALATVDAGMKAVASGKTLHIGFGSYTNEPAANIQSPVNSNVTVVFETIGSSGGTGTATVEVN